MEESNCKVRVLRLPNATAGKPSAFPESVEVVAETAAFIKLERDKSWDKTDSEVVYSVKLPVTALTNLVPVAFKDFVLITECAEVPYLQGEWKIQKPAFLDLETKTAELFISIGWKLS